MDVSFAGASALEIIRLVRLNPSLQLVPVEALDWNDLVSFEGTHGSASKLNFSALGLSSTPTKSHPAYIRVPRAAHRKRVSTIKCLLFPKNLPKRALLQLQTTPESTPSPLYSPRRAQNEEAGSPSLQNTSFDGRRVLVDSVPLACATIAASYQRLIRKGAMSEADAIVHLAELIMEFTGHYGRDPMHPRTGQITEDIPPLVTTSDFQRFVADSKHIKGVSLLSKALLYARDGSRSAMETCLWIVMTFPEEYGFYGFAGAKLNAPLMLSNESRALLRHKTLTPDLMWEASHVAVEYQSFEDHATKASRAEDARRLNDYQVCGILAFFITFDDVRTVAGCDRVAYDIAAAMSRYGKSNELTRINELLENGAARGERARQLSHLLPTVNR